MKEEVDTEEVMQSLMGRQLIEWGQDETMYHLTLDDGRVLIFMALGIVLTGERAVH